LVICFWVCKVVGTGWLRGCKSAINNVQLKMAQTSF